MSVLYTLIDSGSSNTKAIVLSAMTHKQKNILIHMHNFFAGNFSYRRIYGETAHKSIKT